MSEQKAKWVEIAGLWEKTSSGGSYLSGSIMIDGVKLPVVIRNVPESQIKSDKHPRYKMSAPEDVSRQTKVKFFEKNTEHTNPIHESRPFAKAPVKAPEFTTPALFAEDDLPF